MKTEAAILVNTKQPLEIVNLEIPILNEGQILVEILSTGICGTQMAEIDGLKGEDKWLPHCLGHEAVAKVIDIGPYNSKFQKDDKVIISWIKGSGVDAGGCSYIWKDKTVNAGAVTTFQRYSVISENRATKINISDEMNNILPMLGCASLTGMGAVNNVLDAKEGQSIGIFGFGGIGLNALLMARSLKLYPIIVFDTSEKRRALAKEAGADLVVNPSENHQILAFKERFPAGIDFMLEATGNVSVLENTLEYIKNLSGKLVVVGNAPANSMVKISPHQFNLGKSILGTWGGNSNPDRDVEKYAAILLKNRDLLANFLGETFKLYEINMAIDQMRARTIGRPIIGF